MSRPLRRGGIRPLATELEVFANHGEEAVRIRRELIGSRGPQTLDWLWTAVMLCGSAKPAARVTLAMCREQGAIAEMGGCPDAQGTIGGGTGRSLVRATNQQPRRLEAARAAVLLVRALLGGRGGGAFRRGR